MNYLNRHIKNLMNAVNGKNAQETYRDYINNRHELLDEIENNKITIVFSENFSKELKEPISKIIEKSFKK